MVAVGEGGGSLVKSVAFRSEAGMQRHMEHLVAPDCKEAIRDEALVRWAEEATRSGSQK